MKINERVISTAGRTGYGQRLWPVSALLSVAVLIPTCCVLWFMSQAVNNERLVVRQKLVDAYRGQLETIRSRLDADWHEQIAALSVVGHTLSPAAVFSRAVRGGNWDAVVLYGLSGELLYPSSTSTAESLPPEEPVSSSEWELAEQLERSGDAEAAANAYARIAGGAATPTVAARAVQARVRCLLKSDPREAAIGVLCDALQDEAYWRVYDQGRSIAAASALLALELIAHPNRPEYVWVRDRLVSFLNDYEGNELSSGQRLFLMERLHDMARGGARFPTLQAERLAAAYVASVPSSEAMTAPRKLIPTGLPGIWSVASADGSAVGLISEERIQTRANALLGSRLRPSGATVSLMPAARFRESGLAPFVRMPAGEVLADWELALTLDGPNPFDAAAQRRVTVYVWIGLLVIASTLVLTGLAVRYVGRQVKLTRLKNDLIATVSHELKTPLSSIRALVDTLLERDGSDPVRTREYLEMIARENARLSRLIDNFLTFSRMERGRHAFTLVRCRPEQVIQAAYDSMRDRLAAPDCSFELDVAADLPDITADADAMVTVLLNLLDNAWKYTGDSKRISLRAYATGDDVCFEVSDNGIGLSRRVSRRVFERFYQVDQSLARRAGGCGLGLSIVAYIVRAHGGRVAVRSQLGRGSTFTVCMPAAGGTCAHEGIGGAESHCSETGVA
ncbi:MAG TPA: HAMP domain-containing sensor histidine kinase [Phycisphaerae bacterium]|nr:HAMP domain-containing sensor histidine kinase [Phycisphaerae bacterium]